MSDPSATEEPKSARADALFALAMMAVALLTMWGVRNQPRAPYDPVGAAAVPFWTAVAVLALASVLLVRVLLKHSTRGAAMSLFTMSEAVDDSYAVVPRFSVYAVVLSFLYVALIPTQVVQSFQPSELCDTAGHVRSPWGRAEDCVMVLVSASTIWACPA